MRARQPCPDPLRRLAEQQAFVVSREQALGLGLGRHALDRLVRSELWHPLGGGIHHTLPHEPSWPGLAWAGVLLGGDEARLGRQAAAHLHGFGPEPEEISVLVPWDRRPRDRGPWHFVRERPGVRSARSVGGPPRTTAEDTVLDLCDDSDPAQVVHWVTAAVQRRVTTPERLRRAVGARARLRHRRLVLDLLADVDAGVESPLELAYLRDVERAHGLPTGQRQVTTSDRRYRTDVRYEAYRIVVELDGKLGHEGFGRFRDMARDNDFALGGQLTLRYGWPDVTGRSCGVAVQVGAVLHARGWSGTPTTCPRCRRIDSVDI